MEMSEIRPNDSASTEVSGGAKDKNAKAQSSVTIAVSPRALFNMDKEREIYDKEGLEKCVTYHIDHKNVPLEPGAAFPFVKALMKVNSHLKELYPDSKELFDIVIMTKNNGQVGVRLMNSIDNHGLTIERFCMTGGRSNVGYLKAYKTNLYLSNDPEEVTEAIEEGIASATLFMPEQTNEMSDTELRVAFDGDAVLFSDESENVMKESGLAAFLENEKKNKDKTLEEGPLKCFLEALVKLQKKFYAKKKVSDCPIRTYLVTSRGGGPSGVRVLKTLRSWGLEIDEAFFLAGAPKGPMLQVIKPHIFFDDQMTHINGAKELGTVSAHVPYGKHQYKKHIEQPTKKE